METYTQRPQQSPRTLEIPSRKSGSRPSIHELLQSSRNSSHPGFPAPLSHSGSRPAMQMFRLVQPGNIAYNQLPAALGLAPEPLFSTHKVVHTLALTPYNHNGMPGGMPTASQIDPAADALRAAAGLQVDQAQTHLENIRHIEAQLQGAAPLAVGAVVAAAIPQLQQADLYFQSIQVGIPAHVIIHSLQQAPPNIANVLPLFPQLIAGAELGLKQRFSDYFNTQGQTADPQPPGALLGQTPYQVVHPAGGAMPNPIPPGYNTLETASQFHTVPVTSNVHFPMLVSQADQFAINAAYPDPKEAYLSPVAAAAANATLGGVLPNIFSCQLVPLGNQVTIGGNNLTMHKPEYTFQPPGLPAQISRTTASTNACDQTRHRYYPPGNAAVHTQDQHPGEDLSALPNSRVPWQFHVAGSLCQDGPDSISLENGARFTWLVARGAAANMNFVRNPNPQADLDDEMNKTWYFRMYGPKELGQDIRNQTLSRF